MTICLSFKTCDFTKYFSPFFTCHVDVTIYNLLVSPLCMCIGSKVVNFAY